MGLYQDPDLDFEADNYVVIREDQWDVKYFFSDPQVICSPPDKAITLPSEDISFKLETAVLEKLVKQAAVYQLPDLSAIGRNGNIELVVRDKKNDTSNIPRIVVGQTDKEFTFNFKMENIKIIPGSYDVSISSKLLSEFSNSKYDMKYYIALEPDSTFG